MWKPTYEGSGTYELCDGEEHILSLYSLTDNEFSASTYDGDFYFDHEELRFPTTLVEAQANAILIYEQCLLILIAQLQKFK